MLSTLVLSNENRLLVCVREEAPASSRRWEDVTKLRKLLGHIRQIANENKRYATKPHIDVLMVAVSKSAQGKGYATQLISFAKKMAGQKQVPLLVDTDMKLYADMYQHLGFKLYNTKKATNGVTRYNLVWKPAKLSK